MKDALARSTTCRSPATASGVRPTPGTPAASPQPTSAQRGRMSSPSNMRAASTASHTDPAAEDRERAAAMELLLRRSPHKSILGAWGARHDGAVTPPKRSGGGASGGGDDSGSPHTSPRAGGSAGKGLGGAGVLFRAPGSEEGLSVSGGGASGVSGAGFTPSPGTRKIVASGACIPEFHTRQQALLERKKAWVEVGGLLCCDC